MVILLFVFILNIDIVCACVHPLARAYAFILHCATNRLCLLIHKRKSLRETRFPHYVKSSRSVTSKTYVTLMRIDARPNILSYELRNLFNFVLLVSKIWPQVSFRISCKIFSVFVINSQTLQL